MREEEERKNRIELEQFQRKFDRKRKDRKRVEDKPEAPSRPLYHYIGLVVLVIAVWAAVYWMSV